jgi:hypothetical protein
MPEEVRQFGILFITMHEGDRSMLDYNHQRSFSQQVCELIDQALDTERAAQVPRSYLGASRLGAPCERALQYEYAKASVDEGRGFSGRTLRIFEVGHIFEDLVIRWLRLAGFELHNRKANGDQFGFSVAGGRLQGHVDGVITAGPEALGLKYPMLFECKTMADKHWRACVRSGVAATRPIYAAQVATYQAYMESAVEGISRNPALFVAVNKDNQELLLELLPFDAALAQRMSDRAIKVITATEADELLPRGYVDATHFECRMCSWQDRCWGRGQ